MVVAIIGTLAALVIPTLGNVRAAARLVQCTNNLHEVGIKIQMYQSRNAQVGMFPNADGGNPMSGAAGAVLIVLVMLVGRLWILDRVNRRTAEQAVTAAVEMELRGLATERLHGAQSDWNTWVEELSADCFHRREAAHHALLEAGPAILWHLDRWPEHPGAERQRRPLRLRRALTRHPADDSPPAAAAWLAADPDIAGIPAP